MNMINIPIGRDIEIHKHILSVGDFFQSKSACQSNNAVHSVGE